jgi:hypothetical protein
LFIEQYRLGIKFSVSIFFTFTGQYGFPASNSQSQYGSPSTGSGQFGDNFGSGSNINEVRSGSGSGNEIEDLNSSIPGVPGEDYPILAEVPELSFTCDGRVAGGRIYTTSQKFL